MQISEKVTRLKADFDGVYKSGMENSENYKSGYADGKQEGYTEGKADGIEQGKQAEYEAFWDNLFDSVEWGNYNFFFAGTFWNDTNFKPNRDMVPGIGYTCEGMFRSNRVTNIAEMLEKQGVVLDLSTTGTGGSIFYEASTIRLPLLDFSSVKNYSRQLNATFYGCTKLETIDKLIVTKELGYTNTFNNCHNLVNLSIEGVIGQSGLNLQWSTKLSKASIISVINALSTTTSGLSIILPKTAVDREFEEGDRLGSDSQEWEEILQNHSNCTISLV